VTWKPIKGRVVLAWEIGLRSIIEFSEVHGHCYVAPGLVFRKYPLGFWVAQQKKAHADGSLSSAQRSRLESLPFWDWCPDPGDRWSLGFSHLQVYAGRHGDCYVVRSYLTPDGFRLGGWVSRMRTWHRKGELSSEQVYLLEALPGWAWDANDARWNRNYELLKQFADAYGHVQLPKDYQVGGVALGTWYVRQRTRFATLIPARQNLLLELPGWGTESHAARWAVGYHHLQRFVDCHGHADPLVQWICPDSGFRLGPWVALQRRAHRDGYLTEVRRDRLAALPGWTWDHRVSWAQGYEHLVRFSRQHPGTCPPVRHVCDDGFALGRWVRSQRDRWHTGNIPAHQVRELEAVPGWYWELRKSSWERGFEHLGEFSREQGTADVPPGHRAPDGFALGDWVRTQRGQRRRYRMWPSRRERLESLPGWRW
jgi:hypothetical protein